MTFCGKGGPAVARGGKKGKHGKLRVRRRRGVVAFVLLALLLVSLPVALQVPDAIRRAAHPLRYEETIQQVSAEYGLEPAFVAGVVYTESRFRPDAQSSQGAYGLMQILPVTAGFIHERSGITGDYRDPQTNLWMGSWYLSYLQNRYGGDDTLVLAAYNSGESRVDGWIVEGRDLDQGIPLEETDQYVEDVLEAQQTYEELYGRNLDRGSG